MPVRSRILMPLLLGCAAATTAAAPPAISADQDRRQMMDQLGIRALRPGPSGDEKAPDHANYDEAKANRYPRWPDPLVMDDGRPVTTAASWWRQRRPEIVEAYEREVYGRVPKNVPAVDWQVRRVDHEEIGFFPRVPVTAEEVVGHVERVGHPELAVDIRMIVVLPARHDRPVPVLIMFGKGGFPAPALPSKDEMQRIDAAMKAVLARQDPSLGPVFAAHPAFELQAPPQPAFAFPKPGEDPPKPDQLLANGWGYVMLDTATIQADDGSGLRSGIIGLVNNGGPRKPDDWGALRAWAWGASRALDFLSRDPTVDAAHVGIEGVSRWGKAALVTAAFDQRFAMVLVGSSGKGGATPFRRWFGEDLSNLATGEYHWMAGNFLKYDASEARGGPKAAADLPVDASELIALCAPRLAFISYGVPAAGDANWLDQRGSWMATVDASRVWTLLGAPGLSVASTDRNQPMPPVKTGLLGGRLAWRQHDGGHTDQPNFATFLAWADRNIGHPAPAQ